MTDRKLVSPALVPLAQIVAAAPEDQEPVPGFTGQLDGAKYTVVAVLKRTAVLEVAGDRWADRRTAPLSDVLVDPATVAWRPKPLAAGYRAWRGRPRQAAAPAAQRAASDERARADQERKRAVEAAATRSPARPLAAVSRVRPGVGKPADRTRPADRPERPAPDERSAAAADAPAQEPVRLLVEQLEQARARIAELEAERERTEAVHRDLIRRAQAAMQERAS
jgi:hypothetical protein